MTTSSGKFKFSNTKKALNFYIIFSILNKNVAMKTDVLHALYFVNTVHHVLKGHLWDKQKVVF